MYFFVSSITDYKYREKVKKLLCHFHTSDTYHLASVVHWKTFTYGCLLRFPLPIIFGKYTVQTLKNTLTFFKKNMSKLSKFINMDVIFVNSFGQSISHTTTVWHRTIFIIITKKKRLINSHSNSINTAPNSGMWWFLTKKRRKSYCVLAVHSLPEFLSERANQ